MSTFWMVVPSVSAVSRFDRFVFPASPSYRFGVPLVFCRFLFPLRRFGQRSVSRPFSVSRATLSVEHIFDYIIFVFLCF